MNETENTQGAVPPSRSTVGLGRWEPDGPYRSARTGKEYWLLRRENKVWFGGFEYMATPVAFVRKKFKTRDEAVQYAAMPNY